MNLLKCFKKQSNDKLLQKIEKPKNITNTVREQLSNIILNEKMLNNNISINSNDDSQYLYVILPYFNYCSSKSRKTLFMDFINRYKNEPNIRICIVEAKLIECKFELPESLPNIYKHIGITTNDCVWIKESLINTMIFNLPLNWKYMAWIDADITFLNTNWVSDTINKLKTTDVIQLFQTCVNMGPNDEAFKIDKSFGYMHVESSHQWTKTHRYGFWHCGYAWACTKYAYASMGKLIDFGILGAGDHHMALALIGKVNLSHPGQIHDNYKKLLLKFEERCLKNNLKLSYIPGTIIHHWHGRLEDRKYKERWNILTEEQYDPFTDIYYTHDGYIQLTHKGKRISNLLHNYFIGRNEDNMSLN